MRLQASGGLGGGRRRRNGNGGPETVPRFDPRLFSCLELGEMDEHVLLTGGLELPIVFLGLLECMHFPVPSHFAIDSS